MTWDARVFRSDGTIDPGQYNVCESCKHADGSCNIQKISGTIGQLLTSVDIGSDDHMASGSAELRCAGHEGE